ncbi:hypothetical protein GCWU000325_00238 [Alloprevotella tannerae ATCC 51259]|uniref:Uncharacterized protein n=1 Tax=Alloprevotella tannerae ATCC 51259 TaxID=626522 RepID=C9LDG9_9BACT|nr:hypothetical protein GCWU000325_00238 [Alloprevotella tannerae ATCC 51259]
MYLGIHDIVVDSEISFTCVDSTLFLTVYIERATAAKLSPMIEKTLL